MKKLGQGCDHPETPYVVVISWSMIISGISVTQETGDTINMSSDIQQMNLMI